MKVSGFFGGPNKLTPAGYAIRISRKDRDHYFQQTWPSVTIQLDTNEAFEVNLSDSFWRRCIELRSTKIGKWLITHGLAPWPKGKPPRLTLKPIGPRRFRLSRS